MHWVQRVLGSLVTYRKSLKAQSKWLKGSQLFDRGDYANALVLLNDAEEIAPEEHAEEMFHCSLVGRCLVSLGRYRDAASRLRRAVELFERSDRTQWRESIEREQYLLTIEAFARTLEVLNRPAEAKTVWSKVRLMDPTSRDRVAPTTGQRGARREK